MDFAKKVISLGLILSLFQVSLAAVYQVGGPVGWKLGFNYNQWAGNQLIRVGDTLVFKYIKAVHNVLQVTQQNYASCNTSSPVATFSSGSDSITLKTASHHYFICGTPGHCLGGQKVDILVS
ncbi:mavicyanin-like [Rutidosis leptorrhynchoides]|uniref:mavicyanin-like n=1 Tax=Rutidosis leptorrhynchoides TaxID=125765 RepID=UPI003A99BCCC